MFAPAQNSAAESENSLPINTIFPYPQAPRSLTYAAKALSEGSHSISHSAAEGSSSEAFTSINSIWPHCGRAIVNAVPESDSAEQTETATSLIASHSAAVHPDTSMQISSERTIGKLASRTMRSSNLQEAFQCTCFKESPCSYGRS